MAHSFRRHCWNYWGHIYSRDDHRPLDSQFDSLFGAKTYVEQTQMMDFICLFLEKVIIFFNLGNLLIY